MASGNERTPPLKRCGTMDITASEGSALLTQQGTTVDETADHLRSGHVFKTPEKVSEEEVDGQKRDSPRKMTLQRTTTIQATVEASKHVIGDENLGRTRGHDISPTSGGHDEQDNKPHRAPLQRTPTMAATLEDAKHILGDGDLGRTRGQGASATPSSLDEKDAAPNRAPLLRTQTMAATIEDAKHILGDQDLGRTRGQDIISVHQTDAGDAESARPPLQRTSTMAATLEDAKHILGDDERGRTRALDESTDGTETSESDGSKIKKTVTISEKVEYVESEEGVAEDRQKGTLKRTHTMAETLEEAEELLKRKKF